MTVSANEAQASACFPFLTLRLLIVTITIMCSSLCYMSRQNISLAITAMTTAANSNNSQNTNEFQPDDHFQSSTQLKNTHNLSTSQLLAINFTSTIDPLIRPLLLSQPNEPIYGPRYNWGSSRVLGAFFWTYAICQIPGARLGEIKGPKWILFTAGFGSAILSAISPWAASLEATGDWAFFGVRLLMGICQAALFPACYTFLTNWLPIRERQLALPVMNLSAFFGSILALKETGLFMTWQGFGWPYAFYLPALLCFVWSCIWIFLGTSKPDEHPCISKNELEFIETTRGDAKSTSKSLDWLKLFKSLQVWAVIVAFFSSNWPFSLMLQMLPSYLLYNQGIATAQNSKINIIMYIIYCVSAPLIGAAASFLISRRTLGISSKAVRVIFQSISVWGQAVCFILLIHFRDQQSLVVATLYVQMLTYSFVNGGEVHLPTEISADFGGTIYAIANSVGSACGFIVPSVLDWIVQDKTKVDQWNTFLYVAAGVSFVGNLIFVFIAGNEPEDFSKTTAHFCASDGLSQGTFKLLENGLKSASSAILESVELNEMDQLRKTKTKDYSSITMNNDNHDENIVANGRKLS